MYRNSDQLRAVAAYVREQLPATDVDEKDNNVRVSTHDEGVEIHISDVAGELSPFVFYYGASLSGEDDYDEELEVGTNLTPAMVGAAVVAKVRDVNTLYAEYCLAEREAYGDW